MKYTPEHNYNLIQIQEDQSANSMNLPKPNNTKVDKLRELKTMLDENLISNDEYEKEKSKVLNADNLKKRRLTLAKPQPLASKLRHFSNGRVPRKKQLQKLCIYY
jgi:hypothetical protein